MTLREKPNRANKLCMLAAILLAISSIAYAQVPQTDPEQPKEPNYAEVAADARKIADEIEERLIETHMDDAATHLLEVDGILGHPKVEEAYLDLEEMISFCEATGGKAGNCPFKLRIGMSKGAGNTMAQFGKGLTPGVGFTGMVGEGNSGYAGSANKFAMFGPDSPGDKSRASRWLSEKTSEGRAAQEGKDPLAGNVEELSTSKSGDLEFDAEGEARIMEEYRPLIENYFKRLAEEDEKS